MKILIFLCLVFLGLMSSATSIIQPPVVVKESRAVAVTFLGGITGFDPDAYRVVRASMASLLVEGVVDHFITTSWGHEGGSTFCVELNPDPTFTTDRIVNMLQVVHPTRQSIYEYKLQESCLPISELQ